MRERAGIEWERRVRVFPTNAGLLALQKVQPTVVCAMQN
jgi:hypothetical protein